VNGRKLSLRREVLSELTDHDLRVVTGGAPPRTTDIVTAVDPQTWYSCMTFISCAVPFCLIDRETMLDCALAVDVNTVRC
jgi:hypothetical protein